MEIKKEYTLPDGTKIKVTVAGDDLREEDFPILRESTAAAIAKALCDMAQLFKDPGDGPYDHELMPDERNF